jgi:hypothetical protein
LTSIWWCLSLHRLHTVGEPQEEGMMSTTTSFPQ